MLELLSVGCGSSRAGREDVELVKPSQLIALPGSLFRLLANAFFHIHFHDVAEIGFQRRIMLPVTIAVAAMVPVLAASAAP